MSNENEEKDLCSQGNEQKDSTALVVTMEDILESFKNKSQKLTIKQIKDYVTAKKCQPDLFGGGDAPMSPDECRQKVEELVRLDRKNGDHSELEFKNRLYRRRPNRMPPLPVAEPAQVTSYIGTAGEMAVMSELLFNGYNVNRMAVDEGVDLVAVKNNIYYYIQVKTTGIRTNGTFNWSIDQFRFDQYISSGLRYILVGRSGSRNSNLPRNMYFRLDPTTIQNAIYQGCVQVGAEKMSIKVKFDQLTGEPLLYHNDKTMKIGYFMDNFSL